MQMPTTPLASPHLALRFWLTVGGRAVAAEHGRQHLALVAGQRVAGLLHESQVALSGGSRGTGRAVRSLRTDRTEFAARSVLTACTRRALRTGRSRRADGSGRSRGSLLAFQTAGEKERRGARHQHSRPLHGLASRGVERRADRAGHPPRATFARGPSTAGRFQSSIARHREACGRRHGAVGFAGAALRSAGTISTQAAAAKMSAQPM